MAVGFKGAQPIDVNAVADTVFAPLGPQVAAATMPAVKETYQQSAVRQSSAQASLQIEQAQTRADRSLRLDELSLEQARNRSAAVADVTAIYERSKGQFELGRGIAEQNLAQALEAEKQRDALLDERPAFLGNPVRWLADTWKAGKLEDEVARSKETALSAAQDVNALVQISSARIQESVAQATLVDAAYTQERVAEINKGFAAQQGLIDAGLQVAETATVASQNVYKSSVELAQWAQRQAGQDLQERDLAFRKQTFEAQQNEKLQEQAADAQAAEYYMRANGLPATPANKSAAWAAVVALKSSSPQGYADMVRAGAYSLDATSGTEAVAYGLKSGTVGSARTLGGWINDPELVKLGSDAAAREALAYEASLKAQGFAKAKEGGYVGTEAAWFDSLGAAGKKALQTQARELAQQGIDRLPVTEFLTKQAGSLPIASSGLNVGAFGTGRPADTAAFYGVDAKAGAALAKPEVRTRLEMAAAKGGNAKGTITQLAELRKILKEAGVANADATVLQVLSRHAVGTAKEDSLVRHLSDRYGIAPQPQLNIVVGDKVYDLSSQALFTRAMEQGVESLEHVSLLERVVSPTVEATAGLLQGSAGALDKYLEDVQRAERKDAAVAAARLRYQNDPAFRAEVIARKNSKTLAGKLLKSLELVDGIPSTMSKAAQAAVEDIRSKLGAALDAATPQPVTPRIQFTGKASETAAMRYVKDAAYAESVDAMVSIATGQAVSPATEAKALQRYKQDEAFRQLVVIKTREQQARTKFIPPDVPRLPDMPAVQFPQFSAPSLPDVDFTKRITLQLSPQAAANRARDALQAEFNDSQEMRDQVTYLRALQSSSEEPAGFSKATKDAAMKRYTTDEAFARFVQR